MQTKTYEEVLGRAVKLYPEATTDGKAILDKLFEKDIDPDMTKIITSFEAALEWNGTDANDLKFQLPDPYKAGFELEEIAKALRNGKILDYGNPNQQKWYAWRRFIEGSGFRFGGSFYERTATNAMGGPRLCTHDQKTTNYLHQNQAFQPIWDRFLTQKVI